MIYQVANTSEVWNTLLTSCIPHDILQERTTTMLIEVETKYEVAFKEVMATTDSQLKEA